MSTEVDQRVVQMKFDNEDFKKGAAETIATLEHLDAKLDLKNAAKGFESLDKAANKVDFGGLSQGIEKVSVKFSALQVAGITAIQNITNAAMNAGTQLVKSLSLDQVNAGFSKYEEKAKAVRTIVSSTGKSVEEVTEQLKRLNWFTDETSYSFTDMVNNIGKFTNNRIPLEQAISSMEGIANLAAVSGQGINEASRAMYNFSQAIGSGSVKLLDWRSIQTANMDTAEFKETIINTALELGTLVKVGDKIQTTVGKNEVSVTNFLDALKDEWFTSEVLIKTLSKYSDYADEVFRIWNERGGVVSTSQIMEELGQTTMTLGQKAFQAGQEYKTFADAINATKDAVSTSWMNTFEIIFGNVDEAKEVWTALGDELWEIFAGGAEERNRMLQAWKDAGGRETAIQAIGEAWANLKMIINAVADAIDDVFPPMTKDKLEAMTKSVKEFTSQLKLSDEALFSIKVAVKALLIPIKLVTTAIKITVKIAGALAIVLFKLGNAFLTALTDGELLSKVLTKIFGEERYLKMSNAMEKLGDKIKYVFDTIKERFNLTFGDTSIFDRFLSIFSAIGGALSPIANYILDKIVSGLETLSNIDVSGFEDFINNTINNASDAFNNLRSNLNQFKKDFSKWILDLKRFTEFKSLKTNFKNLQNWTGGLVDTFKMLGSSITEGKIFKSIAKQAEPVINVLKKISDQFLGLIKNITPAKILVFSFGTALTYLLFSANNLVNSLANTTSAIGGLANAMTKKLKPNPIFQYARALTILLGAVVALAFIDPTRLKASTFAILGLITGLTAMTGAMAAINKFLVTGEKDADKLKDVAQSTLMMSGSILALAAALKVLSLVDMDGMGGRLLALAAVMAGLVAVAIVMSKKAPKLSEGGLFLLSFAIAVGTLVSSLQKLADADLTGIQKNLASILLIIGMMAVLSYSATKVKFSSASAIILLCTDLLLMIGTLKKLAKVPVHEITKALPQYIILIGMIASLGLAARAAGKSTVGTALTISAMTLTITMLTQCVGSIADIDLGDLAKAGLIIGLLSGILGAIGVLMTSGEGGDAKAIASAGKTFIKMGVTILMLTLAIRYLGGMDQKLVLQGTAVVGLLLTMFTVLAKVATSSEKANKNLASVALVIGTLTASMMLLTLIPFKEILGAAITLSTVMVAFGASMKLMEQMKFTKALANVAIISAYTYALIQVFKTVSSMDSESVLTSAIAISTILVAFGASTHLMQSMNLKDMLGTVITMGLVMTELVAVLYSMKYVQTDGLLEKMSVLSLILAEFTAVTVIVNKLNIDAKSSASGALGIAAVGGILIGAIAAIGAVLNALDSEGLAMDSGVSAVNKLSSIAPMLIAFGAVAVIAGKFKIGPEVIGYAASFAVAVDAVIGIVGALVIGAGALMQIPGFDKVIEDGPIVFAKIGEAIGSFIGNLVGSLVGGFATGGLPAIAENLSTFSDKIAPFIENMSGIDETSVANVRNVVDSVNSLSKLNLGNIDYEAFDTGLSSFGDSLIDFCEKFEASNISESAVNNATNACEALSSIVEVLPRSGGFFQDLIGTKDLKSFAEGLNDFAPSLIDFMESMSDANISEENVNKAITAAKGLTELINSLPRTGGAFQDLIGVKDLSDFASQLVGEDGHTSFIDSIKEFCEEASEMDINEKTVNKVANVGKTMSALANNLPSRGGKLQEWLGEKSLTSFGEDLSGFSEPFAEFCNALSGVEVSKKNVEYAGNAASMLTSLIDNLPKSGGWLQDFFGDKDLGAFGEQLGKFAEGLSSFYSSLQGVGTDAASELVKGLNTGYDKAYESGKHLIRGFTNGCKFMKPEVRTAMQEIAKYSISSMNTALDINSPSKEFQKIGEYTIEGFINGINNKESRVKSILTNFGNKVVETTMKALDEHSPSRKFMKIGGFVIEGFQNGISQGLPTTNKFMAKSAMGFIDAMKQALGIHSPSTVARDEVGRYILEGIYEGITDEDLEKNPVEAAKKMAQNIVSAFQTEFDKLDVSAKLNDVTYQLQETIYGEDWDEDTAAEKRIAYLQESSKNQIEAFNTARAKYDMLKKSIDEGAEVSDLDLANARLEAEQKGLEVAQTAKEIAELKNRNYKEAKKYTNEETQVLKDAYFEDLTSETFQNMIKSNQYTIEEIQKYLQKRYNLDANLKPIVEESTKVSVFDTLNELFESGGFKGLDDIQVLIAEDFPEVVEKSSATAELAVSTSGTSLGSAYTDGVASGITENMASVTDAISNMFSGEGIVDEETKEKTFGGFAGWANDAVDGILKGIDDGKTWLTDKGEEAFDWLLGGAKEESDTHSPSRVMMSFGHDLINGLLIGIDDKKPEIVNKASEMVAPMFGQSPETDTLIKDNASHFVSIFANSIEENSDILNTSVVNVVTDTMTTITNKNAEFYSIGKTIGEQIISGMKESIKSGTNELSVMLKSVKGATASPASAYSGPSGMTIPSNIKYVRPSSKEYSIKPIRSTSEIEMATDLLKFGLTKSLGTVINGVQKIAKSAAKSSKTSGDTVIENTYNQTINSPKAVSATEVYRQTKNLISTSRKKVTGK